MKKIVTALFAICLLGLSLFADEVAIIKDSSGEVLVIRGEKKIPLKKADKLYAGDVIMTEKNGKVGMLFTDGTALSIGPKSLISIDNYIFKPADVMFDFELNMKKGTASFESGKISKLSPESVKFKVPNGVIGVRGTKFFIEVTE